MYECSISILIWFVIVFLPLMNFFYFLSSWILFLDTENKRLLNFPDINMAIWVFASRLACYYWSSSRFSFPQGTIMVDETLTLCLDNNFGRKERKGREGEIGVFSFQIFPMLEGFVYQNCERVPPSIPLPFIFCSSLIAIQMRKTNPSISFTLHFFQSKHTVRVSNIYLLLGCKICMATLRVWTCSHRECFSCKSDLLADDILLSFCRNADGSYFTLVSFSLCVHSLLGKSLTVVQ